METKNKKTEQEKFLNELNSYFSNNIKKFYEFCDVLNKIKISKNIQPEFEVIEHLKITCSTEFECIYNLHFTSVIPERAEKRRFNVLLINNFNNLSDKDAFNLFFRWINPKHIKSSIEVVIDYELNKLTFLTHKIFNNNKHFLI